MQTFLDDGNVSGRKALRSLNGLPAHVQETIPCFTSAEKMTPLKRAAWCRSNVIATVPPSHTAELSAGHKDMASLPGHTLGTPGRILPWFLSNLTQAFHVGCQGSQEGGISLQVPSHSASTKEGGPESQHPPYRTPSLVCHRATVP